MSGIMRRRRAVLIDTHRNRFDCTRSAEQGGIRTKERGE